MRLIGKLLTVAFGAIFLWYVAAFYYDIVELDEVSFTMLIVQLKYLYWIGPLGAAQFLLTAIVLLIRFWRDPLAGGRGSGDRSMPASAQLALGRRRGRGRLMAPSSPSASFLIALLVLMATRTPVAVALSMVTVAGVTIFVAPGALSQLASTAFSLSSNFILVVVPMFILMGEVLAATGIGAALFRAAELWFRRLPGALAIATIWACAGFGSVCGSSPVTASTIGAMAVPQMMQPRLPRHACARLDRRRRHAGHPDPAQHLDGRLRRDHRHLDRPSVHGGHRAGHHACHADVDDHRGHGCCVPPGRGRRR